MKTNYSIEPGNTLSFSALMMHAAYSQVFIWMIKARRTY